MSKGSEWWNALYFGCAQAVETLIQSGVDVNIPDYHNTRRAIHAAICPDKSKILDLLLTTSGVDINVLDRDNNTALDLAIRDHHPDAVLKLQSVGAKVHVTNEKFFRAIREEDELMLRTLICSNANVNAYDDHFTVLRYSVCYPKALDIIVEADGLDINSEVSGESALDAAIAYSITPIEVKLRAHGAVLNATGDKLLSYVSWSLPMVRALIEGKADVNARHEIFGTSVLKTAISCHESLCSNTDPKILTAILAVPDLVVGRIFWLDTKIICKALRADPFTVVESLNIEDGYHKQNIN